MLFRSLNPSMEYAFVKIGDEVHIMAAGLVKATMDACHIEEYEVLPDVVLGSELELLEYQHPFLDRTGLVILGDHVTLEGGTGCVHTAPGHGVEDFEVCVNHYPQLPIVVPVDDGGYLTEEAGQFAGLKVWAAQGAFIGIESPCSSIGSSSNSMRRSAAVSTETKAGTSLVRLRAGPCILFTNCKKAVIPPNVSVCCDRRMAAQRKASSGISSTC